MLAQQPHFSPYDEINMARPIVATMLTLVTMLVSSCMSYSNKAMPRTHFGHRIGKKSRDGVPKQLSDSSDSHEKRSEKQLIK